MSFVGLASCFKVAHAALSHRAMAQLVEYGTLCPHVAESHGGMLSR